MFICKAVNNIYPALDYTRSLLNLFMHMWLSIGAMITKYLAVVAFYAFFPIITHVSQQEPHDCSVLRFVNTSHWTKQWDEYSLLNSFHLSNQQDI